MRPLLPIPLACRVPVELLADPIFMAVAVIGVCLLGISKGGFLGLGVMALPLMSLFVPPLQAAAIILPSPAPRKNKSLPSWRQTGFEPPSFDTWYFSPIRGERLDVDVGRSTVV